LHPSEPPTQLLMSLDRFLHQLESVAPQHALLDWAWKVGQLRRQAIRQGTNARVLLAWLQEKLGILSCELLG